MKINKFALDYIINSSKLCNEDGIEEAKVDSILYFGTTREDDYTNHFFILVFDSEAPENKEYAASCRANADDEETVPEYSGFDVAKYMIVDRDGLKSIILGEYKLPDNWPKFPQIVFSQKDLIKYRLLS